MPNALPHPCTRKRYRYLLGAAVLALILLGSCETVALDPAVPFESPDASLTRLPQPGEALTFLVLGDWGDRGTALQRTVAAQMGAVAARTAAAFVATAGDNFYPDGVASAADAHWQKSFERVYAAPSLRVPWHPVLGNHDYAGRIDAQLAYTARSDRWRFPARYYALTYPIDDTTRLRLLMIDTVPLAALEEATPAGAEARRQLRWIDSTLAAPAPRWTVVVGHHPVYSAGEHGDNDVLRRSLQPLLERHGVAAYVSGHDHDLQHLRHDGFHQFVSGAGAKVRETNSHPLTLFASTRPGFLVVSATRQRLRFQFVDHEGNLLYGAALEPGARK